jgi:hypothetical protein
MRTRLAGWYADPVTVGAARYWDGESWTDRVSWGSVIDRDRTPLEEVRRCSAANEVKLISDFLSDATDRSVISRTVAEDLRRDLHRQAAVQVEMAPGTRGESSPMRPAIAARALSPPRDMRSAAPPPPAGEMLAPPTPLPARRRAEFVPVQFAPPVAATKVAMEPPTGPLARWRRDARHAIRTEISLHGLAYLGVVLLFAGVTGLIVFSFGSVEPWVRSLTELLVPTAVFISAWYLARRGATVVAAGLTVLGGAILPVVAAAALTDGAPFPPDLDGRALPLAQGLVTLAIAGAMMVVVRRTPASSLRFLVAPTSWIAVGLSVGFVRDPVPLGYAVVQLEAVQVAAIFAAMAVTTLLATRSRGPSSLADATRLVVLPAGIAAYLLEFVLAAGEGWPLASTIVVALAGPVLVESLAVGRSDRPSSVVSSIALLVLVAVSAGRLTEYLSVGWTAAAAAIVLVALVEYIGWRRPDPVPLAFGVLVLATALGLAVTEPGAAAATFGALTVWGVARHIAPPSWSPVPDDVGVVPAVSAVITTISLWVLVASPGSALLVTAAIVLALAVAGRIWRPIGADAFWRWFVPAAALAVAAVPIGWTWGAHADAAAFGVGMSAVALALSTLQPGARAWLVSSAIVWSLANAAAALDVERNAQAIVLAVAGAAVVVISLRVACPLCVHTASIGHLAGLAALTVTTWPGWSAVAVVGTATLAWIVVAVVDEQGEAVHVEAWRRLTLALHPVSTEGVEPPRSELGELAPLASLVGFGAMVGLALDSLGSVSLDDAWMTVVSGGVVLAASVGARFVPWRRARPLVLAWVMLALSVAAALVAISAAPTDGGGWAPVAGLAILLAVVMVARTPRPAPFAWVGWSSLAWLSVLTLERLGLDHEWTDVALAAWGSIALLGGLVVDRRRHGALAAGSFVRDRSVQPPVVLGAFAFVVGGVSGLSTGTVPEVGWTALGLAIIMLGVALLSSIGLISLAIGGLATTSYLLLAPWAPLERAWTIVPVAIAALAVAAATRRGAARWSIASWDLPWFVVGHLVAALTMLVALDTGTVVVSALLLAAVSFGVARVIGHWAWDAGSAVLLLAASADAGPGWLALALAALGGVVTVVGLRQVGTDAFVLFALGAAAEVGAWASFVVWRSWDLSTTFYVTAPAAATIALVACTGMRSARVPQAVGDVWAITGALAATVSMTLTFDGDVDRGPAGITVAATMLLLAAAMGTAAPRLGGAARWAAAVLAAWSAYPFWWGIQPEAAVATATGTAIAVGAALVALVVVRAGAPPVWTRPISVFSIVVQALTVELVIDVQPREDLLAVVLFAVAIELIAHAVVFDRPYLALASPAAACGGVIVALPGAIMGVSNWYLPPLGITLLVTVGVLRAIRRSRGGDPSAVEVMLLELVGMGALVGAPLAETVSGRLWVSLVATAIGAVLMLWGASTRVEWRAGAGALIVLVANLLLIGVPLASNVTWRGPSLWITLTVIGTVVILVATYLERSRDRLHEALHHINEMTADWERIPRAERPPAAEHRDPG